MLQKIRKWSDRSHLFLSPCSHDQQPSLQPQQLQQAIGIGRLGEEAASFITRHPARPFFVYLAFNAVHAPLQAPADEIARFDTGHPDRNTRLAMGKRMDDAIGNVVAKLKREGLWETTLLFFISDNGGPLPQSANNTPLRGGKHMDYEGGIRVPFLVCWPAKLKPGESQAVVSSLDILPTALAAAGVTATTPNGGDV